MNDMNDKGAARDKLWTMIKDIRFAMFTTRHGSNGHLHARPMATQNRSLEADDSLWFFMSKQGDPVRDLKTQPMVGVVYANPSSDTYVSVSGTAAMLEDSAKKRQLWSKSAEAWFPGGPTDPDLALVQVQIIHANYWDVKESKLVQLFAIAKAVVTGKRPAERGEHAEVRMR
ncbi:MAG TPA: pyridoxamine 5'-phosphate oxidase family protein [Caldimonas sp.]|nr:pyridoxamine 5'-phosphate oxidase family protein [Caldimonas sp.]